MSTKHEYEVMGYYEMIWECVYTADTLEEARRVLKDYQENEKHTLFKIRRVVVKKRRA